MSTEEAPRRSRRRGRGWLITAVILVVLVVVAIIAFRPVDEAVRAYLEDQIEASLRTSLGIEADVQVTVDIGGGSTLRQLAAGELARVDVSTDRVTFGEFTGPANFTAMSVPTDTSKPVGTLDIDFSIAEDQLLKVSKNLSGVPLSAVTVDSSQILVSAEITALFISVPVSVGLLPSAIDGQIAFTPNTISVAGADFSANELRKRFGGIAEQALTTQNLCIAEGLPKVFVLDEVNPEPGALKLHFTGDGVVLSEGALGPLGTCAAS